MLDDRGLGIGKGAASLNLVELLKELLLAHRVSIGIDRRGLLRPGRERAREHEDDRQYPEQPPRAEISSDHLLLLSRPPARVSAPVAVRIAIPGREPLDGNRLPVGGLPAPGTRAVATLDHAFLVDLRNDLAVAGQQRFRRAHFGAERQLALGEAVAAVLREFFLGAVSFGAAGAIGAFVHLAARAEVANLGILRRAERAGVEAIAAADAQVLGVQHDTV